MIQECCSSEVDSEMNRCAKYDKTSRSKNVIIEAKDKRIAKLEKKTRNLKSSWNIFGITICEGITTAATCSR